MLVKITTKTTKELIAKASHTIIIIVINTTAAINKVLLSIVVLFRFLFLLSSIFIFRVHNNNKRSFEHFKF